MRVAIAMFFGFLASTAMAENHIQSWVIDCSVSNCSVIQATNATNATNATTLGTWTCPLGYEVVMTATGLWKCARDLIDPVGK